MSAAVDSDKHNPTSQQALLAVIWRVNQDSVECVLELWCQIRWPVAVVLDKAF